MYEFYNVSYIGQTNRINTKSEIIGPPVIIRKSDQPAPNRLQTN